MNVILNAVVHGGGSGKADVRARKTTVQVWITDWGKGIAWDSLHRATLERGYTAASSLDHGFWLMLKTCDRVFLYNRPKWNHRRFGTGLPPVRPVMAGRWAAGIVSPLI